MSTASAVGSASAVGVGYEAPPTTTTTNQHMTQHQHQQHHKNIVACTEYRNPSLPLINKTLSHVETIRFVVIDFVNLPQQQGEYFETQEALEAHGFIWKLQIWPRGSSSEGFVSIYLACVNASSTKQAEICGKIQFGPPSSSGVASAGGGGVDDQQHQDRYSKSFQKTFDNPAYSYSSQRIELQEIIDNCLEVSTGNWIIDVDIQIYIPKLTTSIWYPPKVVDYFVGGQNTNILPPPPPPGRFLLESKLEADVLFATTSMNNEEEEMPYQNDDKPPLLHAHKCILVHRAPGLYEFVKDIPKGDTFEIPDTSYEILKVLLEYIYVGTIPTINTTTTAGESESEESSLSKATTTTLFARRLLMASSRYCLILLKLHIESEICNKLLTPQNAADWLVFGDSYCCALLKESCFEMYAEYKLQIKSSQGWTKVKESSDLLEELLDYYSDNSQRVPRTRRRMLPNDSHDYNNMTVGMLRDKLLLKRQQQQQQQQQESYHNHLEVLDGTRSMLIQRLKE